MKFLGPIDRSCGIRVERPSTARESDFTQIDGFASPTKLRTACQAWNHCRRIGHAKCPRPLWYRICNAERARSKKKISPRRSLLGNGICRRESIKCIHRTPLSWESAKRSAKVHDRIKFIAIRENARTVICNNRNVSDAITKSIVCVAIACREFGALNASHCALAGEMYNKVCWLERDWFCVHIQWDNKVYCCENWSLCVHFFQQCTAACSSYWIYGDRAPSGSYRLAVIRSYYIGNLASLQVMNHIFEIIILGVRVSYN